MNERLKQLALQVGSTHKDSLGVYQFYSHELEAFAKLVIQEYEREKREERRETKVDHGYARVGASMWRRNKRRS